MTWLRNWLKLKTPVKTEKKVVHGAWKIIDMFSCSMTNCIDEWTEKYSEAWEVILGIKELNENAKETLCTS